MERDISHKTKKLAALRDASRKHPLFAGLDHPEDPAIFTENAATLAAQLKIPQLVLDYLYAHSRCRLNSRDEWEHDLRIATAMRFLISGFAPGGFYLDGLLDTERTQEFKNEVAVLDPGVLVLISHDGFTNLRLCFERCFRGNHFVFKGPFKKPPEAMLFDALRALREGKHVWVAPEGQTGRQVDTLDVAGMEITVAGGAAMLAYETGVPTVYFSVHQTEGGLAPMLRYGPQRETETRVEFRRRLHAFYGEQLGRALTGHPKDMPLWPRRIKAIMEHVNSK